MSSSETIKLKNGRTWQVSGGGAGPTLLWLHGLSGLSAVDPMLSALERKHRVVAPLAPGFNDLAEIDEIGNIHELVLDYDDLLEHLQLDDIDIVGHSFGAMIGAEIAAHFPRRAKKLVVVTHAALDRRAQCGEHQRGVEALLVHHFEPRRAVAERLGRADRRAGDLAQRQALGILAAVIFEMRAGRGDNVEGRVGDVVRDLAADGELGAAAHADELQRPGPFLRQVARERVRRLVEMVVGVIDLIRQIVAHRRLPNSPVALNIALFHIMATT